MRKWLPIVGGVSLLLAAAALFWPDEPATSPKAPPARTAELFEFEPVGVKAEDEGLTLTGKVLDAAGKAVASAEVSIASSAQASLLTVSCGRCGEPIVSCNARETALTVAELLRQRRGLLEAASSTRTDGEGRFRFERLKGVSFTVWARADGLGESVRERAAPGEPVELVLPPLRSIAGSVHDAGRPIAGARVWAVSRRLALPREATTDSRGLFELRGLGEGPFYVLAEADGFLPAAIQKVEAGPRPVKLVLSASRTLEVTVQSGGKPKDATVRLSGDHLAREAATKGGRARFGGLYPDQVVVTAAAGDRSAASRAVTLDQLVTSVVLDLEPGGRMTVAVVDENGQSAPAPKVSLLTPGGEVVEEKRGRYGELLTFGPVGEGDYLLRGEASGFKPADLPVTIRAGDQAVELVLTQAVVISGRVLDEYGRPAPGISILVTPTGDSVVADDSGRFEAQVPSPGLYQLHAHHSDWGGGLVKVTAPATDVTLQLEPRAGAHVTVLAEGRRIEGADVVLFIERDGSFRSDRPSGSDGVVLMRGMPPGTYWLVASHPEWLPSERREVTIADGQLLRVTAELRRGAAISGEVVDTSGAKVPGVSLSVIPRSAEPTVSDGLGRFELAPLRQGMTYRLEARHSGYEQLERVQAVAGGEPVRVVMKRRAVFRGRVLSEDGRPLKRFRVDDQAVESPDGRFELPLPATDDRVIFAVEAAGHQPLMVDRPATADLGDLVLEKAPALWGVVRDDAGLPVADAVVTCDLCNESVLSAADGKFQLSSPPFVLQYVVTAKKGRLSGSRQVSGSTVGPIEVRLFPAVQLSGAAYLPDGKPAPGVEIEGLNVERGEPVTIVTGADGAYRVELPVGSYRFAYEPSGGVRQGEPTALLVALTGESARLDFGPAPTTASVTVRLSPQPGWALWVVRGDLSEVGDPPLELLRSQYAQLVYQPLRELVTFQALPPGRYTLVYASFHAETPGGPIVQRVDLPRSGEVVMAK